MRKLLSFTCFIVAILLAYHADSAQENKRYQIKSAIIEYEISGTQSGTEKVYFDHWGQKEAKFTNLTISMLGMTHKTNTLTLMDGEWSYSIDMDRKSGTKLKIGEITKEMMKNSRTKNMSDFSEQVMKNLGAVDVGTEKVLGYKCQMLSIIQVGSKVWVYKGIPLKIESSFSGMKLTYEAKKFKENAVIDPKHLEIPDGIKIVDAPDIRQMMQTINESSKKSDPTMDTSESKLDVDQPKSSSEEAPDMQNIIDQNSPQIREALGALKSLL